MLGLVRQFDDMNIWKALNIIQYHNKYDELTSHHMSTWHKFDGNKVSESRAATLLILTAGIAVILGFIWV